MKDFNINKFLDMHKYRNTNLFNKVVELYLPVHLVGKLHVNGNVSGTYHFIYHVNNLVEILSYLE